MMGLDDTQVMREKCTSCGSSAIRAQDGYNVCIECGTCQPELVFVNGPFTMRDDSRNAKKEYRQAVATGKLMRHTGTMGSYIGAKTRSDIFETSKFLRIKKYNRIVYAKNERRLQRALAYVNKAASLLNVTQQTVDRAAYLVRQVLPHFPRGSTKQVIIVLLTLAIREHHMPVTESQVISVVQSKQRRKYLNNTKLQIMAMLGIKWPKSKPEWFVPAITSSLANSTQVRAKLNKHGINPVTYFHVLDCDAHKVLANMDSCDYGGRAPNVIAAGILYALDRVRSKVLTTKGIAKVTGVAEYSIRAHYRVLWKSKLQEG
jgi:transcription initiation factor TFIIIB Brf1 subunit/transcription initiation factor TFIIB